MKKILRHQLLMLVFLLCAIWQRASAQNTERMLTFNSNSATLQQFIQQVKSQQGLEFTFDQEVSSLMSKKITVRKKKVPVSDALKWLTEDLAVKYKVVDNYIILSRDSKGKPASSIQKGHISGKIVDETREPLPGATIKVIEAGQSTTAANDGSFSIPVPAGVYTLEVTFLSFQTETIKNVTVEDGGRTSTTVTLKARSNSLNEVVVTALGIKKRERSLGYASAQLSASDVSNVPQPNVLNALSGRIAGVNVRATGSDPGSSVMVTIRGQSSLTKDNQPLYVIDGVPVAPALQNPTAGIDGKQTIDYGSPIGDLSADDIASITVLKGASAAALYGSRAGSGVILITTKSGAEKKGLGISFNSTAMFDKAYLFPHFQNEYGSGDSPVSDNTLSTGAWGQRLNTGTKLVQWNSPLDANGNAVATDWIAYPNRVKDFFNTGHTYTNNIAVSKSGEAGDFRISYANMQNKGIVPNTDIKRNNLNFAGNYNIKKSIRLSTNLAYTNNQSDNRPSAYSESVTSQVYKLTPNINIDELRNYWVPGKEGIKQYNPLSSDDNPFLIAYEETNGFNRNRLTGHVQLAVDLMPNLTLTGRTGLDYYSTDLNEKRPFSAKRNPTGAYLTENNYFKEQNSDFLLTYKSKIGAQWSYSVSAGGNQMDQKMRSVRNYTGTLTLPGIYNLSNAAAGSMIYAEGASHKRINSVYGLGEISYKQSVFLNLTARNDWSSTLPPENNSYFYPSASLSVIASDLLGIKWDKLSYLKLRGNISQVGSDTDPYQLYNVIPFDSDWGSVKRASLSFDQKNSQLKPEIATSYETGADISFFQDRLGMSFTWYKTNNKNQIIQVPTTIASGASTKLINAGNIQNSGIELSLNAVPVKGKFTWRTDLNFTRNRNKVISLTPGITNYLLGSTDGSNVQYLIREGTQMGDFYARSWQKVPDGAYAGQALLNSKGLLQQATDFEKVGNYNPDFILGANNSFSYGPLTLNVLVDWRKGGQYYSYVAKSLIDDGFLETTVPGRDAAHGGLSWTDGDGAKRNDGMIMPGVIANGDGTYRQNDVIIAASDYYDSKYWKYYENDTFSATYIKLKEVSLTYTFSKNTMRHLPFMSNLSLSFIGYNLYTWTKAKMGFDPETTMSLSGLRYQGVGHWTLPGTRSYGIKLSCNF
ncbi:SusC/RagA family TonB-linked outer membrane protein [Mucilaginibacter aquariorum]|uniref:SusC/RagA family TonB-linked outer membrane protein n=1 Tax=Mucilaginibacter aquariorum TaxID=2967225 RepID=A0ABT1SY91_9SPHI|nr:SusC/RagA family TonB-linked outer membrane protein [Mucilaginibacter aquariorum]MCQ6957318.1 SusC/RagA family TonB-linked outer membrane protein [Mucilaginibacter aquariorum]